MTARTTRTSQRARRATALAGLTAVGLALASCGSASTTSSTTDAASAPATASASTSASADASASADPSATDGSTTEAGTLDGTETAAMTEGFTTEDTQGGDAQGGGDLLPVEVRTGDHEGTTRVVIEFEGSEAPGWAAGYVKEATTQGKGDPIDVGGSSVLAVTIRGLGYPEPADAERMVSGAVAPSSDGVNGLYFDPVYEGQALLYIGLDTERPYAVSTLTDPVRVVVDIQN